MESVIELLEKCRQHYTIRNIVNQCREVVAFVPFFLEVEKLLSEVRAIITEEGHFYPALERDFHDSLQLSVVELASRRELFQSFWSAIEANTVTQPLAVGRDKPWLFDQMSRLDTLSLQLGALLTKSPNEEYFLDDALSRLDRDERFQVFDYIVLRSIMLEVRLPLATKWAHILGLSVLPIISASVQTRMGFVAVSVGGSGDLSPLDIGLELYQRDSCPEAVDFVCYVCTHLGTGDTVRLLRDADVRGVAQRDIYEVCLAVLRAAETPLTASLQLAGVYRTWAEQDSSRAPEHEAAARTLTQSALDMLEELSSDQAVTVFLEQPDLEGASAVRVAIETHNVQFFSHPRVSRILFLMFSIPDFLMEELGAGVAGAGKAVFKYTELVHLFVFEPRTFLRLPLGKFLVRAVYFLGYLALYSCIIPPNTTYKGTVMPWGEVVFYLSTLGFIAGIVDEVRAQGFYPYLRNNRWNYVDLFNYSALLLMFLCRLYRLFENQGAVDQGVETTVDFLYTVLGTAVSTLLWVRLVYVFQVSETLGPLQLTIFRLSNDVRNFSFIFLLFITGFSLAWYTNLGPSSLVSLAPELNNAYSGGVYGFQTVMFSFLTCIEAILGQFTTIWTVVESMQSAGYAAYAYFLYVYGVIFVFLVTIVLVNLLIAMMTKSYSVVQDVAVGAFLLGRAELIFEYDQMRHTLPPPLSTFVFVTAAPILLRKKVKEKFYGFQMRSVGSDAKLLEGDERLTAEMSQSGSMVGMSLVAQPLDMEELRRRVERRVQPHMTEEHWRTVKAEVDSFEEWRCGLCHHLNTSGSFPALLRYLLDRDTSVDKVSLRLLSVRARVCHRCFRVKRVRSLTDFKLERISFWYFFALFWLPLVCTVFLPYLIMLVKRAMTHWLKGFRGTNADPGKQKHRTTLKERSREQLREPGAAARRKWVERTTRLKKSSLEGIEKRLQVVEELATVIAAQLSGGASKEGDVRLLPQQDREEQVIKLPAAVQAQQRVTHRSRSRLFSDYSRVEPSYQESPGEILSVLDDIKEDIELHDEQK